MMTMQLWLLLKVSLEVLWEKSYRRKVDSSWGEKLQVWRMAQPDIP